MRFAFIEAEKANYSIDVLCRVMHVSRSGFYAWCHRESSQRQIADQALLVEIWALFRLHRGRYGSPRIWRDLLELGWRVSRKRVARLMRENGIIARPTPRFVTTTQSEHDFQRFDNVVDRNFEPEAPNDIWAADITYIPTRRGWLYLAVILDLYSRRVVG